MPDLTEDSIHRIVRDETSHLATQASLEGLAGTVAGISTRLDRVESGLNKKMDTMLTKMDVSTFTQLGDFGRFG